MNVNRILDAAWTGTRDRGARKRLEEGGERRFAPTRLERRAGGYLLMEALVYIGLVFLVLGVGYAALFRCIDNSVALRRSAEDISNALNAGERWRADLRAADRSIRLETLGTEERLRLSGARGEVMYRFAEGGVFRRVGEAPWVRLIGDVKQSTMVADPREKVTAWRWELELQPRAKGGFKPGRVRPLFTFLTVPGSVQSVETAH